jgi:glycolate oxidase iron-sulfur subunit
MNENPVDNGSPLFPFLSDETLLNCMHCGLCLPTCPTYTLTHLERYSPRGRIQLTRMVFEGSLNDEKEIQDVSDAVNTCLGCLACVTACPAGVDYETIFESAKDRVHTLETNTPASLFKDFIMKHIFPYPTRFKAVSRLLYVLQQSPLERNLPDTFRRAYQLAPAFSEHFFDDTFTPNSALESVQFLSGCLMNTAFSDVHSHTATVLESVGKTIQMPKGQICCGALHAHNGYLNEAKKMAEINILAFEEGNAPILTNSAGCGAMMKHYPNLFKEGSLWHTRATRVAKRVCDLSEFLTDSNFAPTRKFNARLTYQDACHLEHGQKIKAQPRALLRRAFTEVVELNSPECCGSAGIYNLLQPDWSEEFLKLKVEAIRKSQAEFVVTANPGCLLQLQYGLKQSGVKATAIHLATALQMALKG